VSTTLIAGIENASKSVARSAGLAREDQGRPALGLWVQLVYGAGEIPNAVKTIAFGLFTLYFYTTVLGLSGTLVGIASAIGLLWDAAIDPYIGYVSDRSRVRFGRRHTFMLAGALTMGATFWAFFHPPAGLSTTGLFVWLLVTSLLVRTATSVYGIPYFALGAELSSDYQERTSITGIRGAMALVGTLTAASLAFVVFFPDATPGVDPKLNRDGYAQMGLVFGVLMTLLGVLVTWHTLPWRRVPPAPSAGCTAHPPASFVASFVQSMANRSFRALFASYSLFFLAMVINSALSIHYLTHYAKVTASTALSSFQLAFYLGALVGVAVWFLASRWIEKQRLYLLALFCVAGVMLMAVFLVGEGRWLGAGNIRAVAIGHGLGGFFGSVLWFIPGSMIADVADEDELTTGARREGAFFGLFYFGQQIAAGVSLLAAGALVEGYAGLQPGQSDPSPLTVSRMGVLYGILPALLVSLAAVPVLRYSLTRSRVHSIQAELSALRGSASGPSARGAHHGG